MRELRHKGLDVLVVGAGPAGLAAAALAAECGSVTGLIDDNPQLGGQIWRGESLGQNTDAAQWGERVRASRVEILCGTHVVHHNFRDRTLLAEGGEGAIEVKFSKLILATGARERLLPFPGWTLPNVMAAGGMQAMAKSGLPIAGKRVVVAGTGPLLLAVAAYLRQHGADVRAICEQASWGSLAQFGSSLLLQPSKLKQALALRSEIRGVAFWPNAWPARAIGQNKLEKVVVSRAGREHEIACDYLACGFHLVPNTELAACLGCRIERACVLVDAQQQTSLEGVYAAGEPTGIGGLEIALLEGQIAGSAAADKGSSTDKLRRDWQHLQGFASRLNQAFQLRPELKRLPDQSTIVCRCEDVTHERVSRHKSWRDAKNQTRCGMGPCQGRICGPATEFLYDWAVESIRPPIFPVSLGNLAAMTSTGEQQ
jgi:NADPH-dependent 2,4-dienoyl-CoA reductase/sulfur reductase-like enzyme